MAPFSANATLKHDILLLKVFVISECTYIQVTTAC